MHSRQAAVGWGFVRRLALERLVEVGVRAQRHLVVWASSVLGHSRRRIPLCCVMLPLVLCLSKALRTMSMVAKRGDEELIAKVTESLRDPRGGMQAVRSDQHAVGESTRCTCAFCSVHGPFRHTLDWRL